ncbi:hypothetical protein SteCoe_35873 [Stentor coeruleus]|uniref:Phospholipid-transporting ATPase n=1 Tax=Stentor coeruleus TaxID=5963 RepID=A0A1R2ARC2_9CILI|nr:hypothetical protein SteCoe_35873 [Stentor coeruleus]
MKELLMPDRKESTILFSERRINLPIQNQELYKSNKISTCKYNAITFLPKNLFIQFQKLANIYFLLVAVLQSIPQISNSNGIPNILLPLSLVLTVSAIRDILEDKKRRKSDKEENSRICLKMTTTGWQKTLWQNIKVGDVVKILKDEYFPADLIFCASSDNKGIGYIETKNIDGETNLKQKVADKNTQNWFTTVYHGQTLNCDIVCEEPNPVIYQFSGLLRLENFTIPLSLQQFLIRGSSLKNTNWVIGLTVYTGHESKIMLNSVKTKSKFSTLENQMNKQIVIIFLLQISLCIFCGFFYMIWYDKNKTNTSQYLDLESSENNLLAQFTLSFFTWMLNFTNFVPISLLVTLEMVKFCQGLFITWDLQMYYAENDTPARVQSSSLNEELGQINYVFSDKTGTLTCNIMEFRKLTVEGEMFGTENRMLGEAKIENVDFVDSSFIPERFSKFVMHLACCHSIITENTENGIEYRASSPDELALVSAAGYFGMKFIGRDADQNIEIDYKGKVFYVKLLNTIEFTSDRRRMTVVVRLGDGKIKVLCKGADSVIMKRIRKCNIEHDTCQHLEIFAKEGLRTLVLAEKEVSEEYYNEWNERFVNAMKDIHRRNEMIYDLGDEIERDLELIGATAIEDKLQEKVQETIKELKDAEIKVWVLTGDKIETAINIGYSCGLLSENMTLLEVSSIHKKDIMNEIENAIVSKSQNKALVISGDSLLKATHGESIKKFIKLTDMCQVVLACRVSPQQKAQLVQLIRDYKPEIRTLSIGDGANDVNMITAAHVGLEGQQAARSSDYSISQFLYLRRLLFVHGRECYRRNSILICYNFYKNVLLVLPLLYYGSLAVFSGQLIFNTWNYQLFNVVYASLPIVLYAIFDKEMDLDKLNFSHYKIGSKSMLFSTTIFWKWVLEGTLQALLICFICIYGICYTAGHKETGRVDSLWVASTLMYGMVVILVNIKVVLFSYAYYWFNVTIIIASIAFYFIISKIIDTGLPISEWLNNYEIRGSIDQMFENPNTYVIIILITYLAFFIQPLYFTIRQLIKVRTSRIIVGYENMQSELK